VSFLTSRAFVQLTTAFYLYDLAAFAQLAFYEAWEPPDEDAKDTPGVILWFELGE